MKEKCISRLNKEFKSNFISKNILYRILQEKHKWTLFWFSETFPLTIKCLISFKTGPQSEESFALIQKRIARNK